MATKAAKKKAGGTKKAAAAAKPKAPAKGRPARAKAAAKSAPRASAKVKAKVKAKAAARPGIKARQKPETLRLRGLSVSYTVGDLAKSLRFYVDGMGFTVNSRWEKDGQLMGVMLLAGDCELGLSQDDWAKGTDRVKGVGFRVYAETAQDLGKLAKRIRAQGFSADGPKKETWGATTVTATDPDGFVITFHDPMD